MSTYIKTLIDENNNEILPRTRTDAITTVGGTLIEDAINAKQSKTDNNLQTTAKTIVGAINELNGSGANSSLIADDYSSSATYNIGDYCIHDKKLYLCISAIAVAEEWTAAHWNEVKVTGELKGKQNITDNTFNTTSKTVPGAINELNTGKINNPAQSVPANYVPKSDGNGGIVWGALPSTPTIDANGVVIFATPPSIEGDGIVVF